MKNKILVTGARGFVGRYLLDHLKGNKDNEVYGTDLEGELDFQLDITDKQRVSEVLKEIKPNQIYHLAGFSSQALSFKFPEKCMEVNVDGTMNILEAFAEYGVGRKTMLVVTSAAVYGKPQYVPIDEKHIRQVTSPYSESRIKQEDSVLAFQSDVNVIVSRSFNHTGVGQPDDLVIPEWIKQVAQAELGLSDPIVKVGNIEVEREFSDVQDVIEAYEALVNSNTSGIFNVCNGQSYSLNDLLKYIVDLSSKDIKIEVDPEKFRPVDVKVVVGDNSKLMEATSWSPKKDFYRDTISNMYNHYINLLK